MVGRKDLRRRPFSALIIKGIEVTLPALRRDDDVADPPCAGGLRRSVAMPRHGVTRTATRTGNLGRGGGKVWKVYDDEHSDHQKIR